MDVCVFLFVCVFLCVCEWVGARGLQLAVYGWKGPSFLGIDLVWSRARVPEVAE